MNKQKGFSLVEGLLIFIALTIAGFGGWKVLKQDETSNQETVKNSEQKISSQENLNTNQEESVEKTNESNNGPLYTKYTNNDFNCVGYTLDYPSDWNAWSLEFEGGTTNCYISTWNYENIPPDGPVKDDKNGFVVVSVEVIKPQSIDNYISELEKSYENGDYKIELTDVQEFNYNIGTGKQFITSGGHTDSTGTTYIYIDENKVITLNKSDVMENEILENTLIGIIKSLDK